MPLNPMPIRAAPRGAWYLPPRGFDLTRWAHAVAEVCRTVGLPNPLDGAQFHPDGRVTWRISRPPAPPPPPPVIRVRDPDNVKSFESATTRRTP